MTDSPKNDALDQLRRELKVTQAVLSNTIAAMGVLHAGIAVALELLVKTHPEESDELKSYLNAATAAFQRLNETETDDQCIHRL